MEAKDLKGSHLSAPLLCSCTVPGEAPETWFSGVAPNTTVTVQLALGGIPLTDISKRADFGDLVQGVINASTLPVVSRMVLLHHE